LGRQLWGEGDEYVAIIIDTRDDKSLGRPHIDNGTRFAVPNTKIKWDHGNPTGHGIIFIGYGGEVYCYLPPGGGQANQKHVGITRRAFMNLKLTVAILAIAAVPLCAQAQKPSAAIVTHADARKVLEIIKGDRAKTQTYCDMVKLGHEMAAADEKKADELNQKMGELQRKLGPEYAALMDGFQDLDLGSEVGQEISSMFAELDGLCGG
jgi:hypothetical protein